MRSRAIGIGVLIGLACAIAMGAGYNNIGKQVGGGGTQTGPIYMAGFDLCFDANTDGHCYSVDGTTLEHKFGPTDLATVDQDGRVQVNSTLNDPTGDESGWEQLCTANKATSGTTYCRKTVMVDTASPGTSYLDWWGVGTTYKAFLTSAGSMQVREMTSVGLVQALGTVRFSAGGPLITASGADLDINPDTTGEINMLKLANFGTAPFVPGNSPTSIYAQGTSEFGATIFAVAGLTFTSLNQRLIWNASGATGIYGAQSYQTSGGFSAYTTNNVFHFTDNSKKTTDYGMTAKPLGAAIMVGASNGEHGYIQHDGDSLMLVSSSGPVYAPQSFETPLIKLDASGCFAVLLKNSSGATRVQGEIVETDAATDGGFDLADADAVDPIGSVLDATCANGADCWICQSGRAKVLLKDTTACTRHYWCKVSDVAGRADCTNATAPGAVLEHFSEIGHSIQSVGSGTDVLCETIQHFL